MSVFGSSCNEIYFNVDGFMPRGKQFGYMFTQGFASKDDLYIETAHELGHGMFQLKHPFDNDYKIPAYSTYNLMDYTPGATHIAKWQWDLIHDPGVVLMVFEKDTDAMQKAKREQINDALKYYNNFKLDQSIAKFKNIPSNIINTQVKERLDKYGHPIQQGGFFEKGSIGQDATWLKNNIISWLVDTKVLVFFVNSRYYNAISSNDNKYEYDNLLDELVSENYGRHFITVHKILLENDNITITFWDRGNADTKTKTFKSYSEFENATFKYWLIKNTHE